MGILDWAIWDMLKVKILSNKYIDLDLWSGIHFLAGIIIVIFLSFFTKNPLIIIGVLFGILLFWEIFEISVSGITDPPLLNEGLLNAFTDIWIGLLAGIITLMIILGIGFFSKTN